MVRRLPARKLEKAHLKLMTKAVLYSKQVTVLRELAGQALMSSNMVIMMMTMM